MDLMIKLILLAVVVSIALYAISMLINTKSVSSSSSKLSYLQQIEYALENHNKNVTVAVLYNYSNSTTPAYLLEVVYNYSRVCPDIYDEYFIYPSLVNTNATIISQSCNIYDIDALRSIGLNNKYLVSTYLYDYNSSISSFVNRYGYRNVTVNVSLYNKSVWLAVFRSSNSNETVYAYIPFNLSYIKIYTS
ncbi:MAG: hypothetical protein ARM1_0788 [Candidatus Micrarchaeota archaeon]|nr:MAG: hypothetical protein ARM1_0788 [Candidatus Micrarchaeota archaeon]